MENKVEGEDLRPIMGATVGPNLALTNFIAKNVVKEIAKEASVGNDCESTEELLCEFEEYNKTRVQTGLADKNIFSYDSSSLTIFICKDKPFNRDSSPQFP